MPFQKGYLNCKGSLTQLIINWLSKQGIRDCLISSFRASKPETTSKSSSSIELSIKPEVVVTNEIQINTDKTLSGSKNS